MMAKLCEICRINKAELPDRERMGRPIKRVCRECHSERLRDDLRYIMDRRKRRARPVGRFDG